MSLKLSYDTSWGRRGGTLAVSLIDAVRMMSRALIAAHCYETLRFASGQVLAKRGLTRGDLPRAAYIMLTSGH